MKYVRLSKTDLKVSHTAFGVLPIQRTSHREATRILRRAFEAGITFYDTARAYTDSEEKIGNALSDVRDQIVIATKSGGQTRDAVLQDLETSLRYLKTDYVDILQLHNPKELPNPEDADSSYAALIEAREHGMIRHIGITNHSRERALEAVRSGQYETLQFPLCTISSPEDWELAQAARDADVGVIAMKALSGGLLTNARAAFAFMRQFDYIVPIWGIQRMKELEEFLSCEEKPPILDEFLNNVIQTDRTELSGQFCRACGYCLPCPVEIPIPMAARMEPCLRRMPSQRFFSKEWQAKMNRINDCIECGHCRDHCPYNLDTPKLLKQMLEHYQHLLKEITC